MSWVDPSSEPGRVCKVCARPGRTLHSTGECAPCFAWREMREEPFVLACSARPEREGVRA